MSAVIKVGDRVEITRSRVNSAPVNKGDLGIVMEHNESGYYSVLMPDGREWNISPKHLEVVSLGPTKTYREEMLRTATRPDKDYDTIQARFAPAKIVLTNAAMGLSGEAGEFVDLIKKVMFHGKTIGDVHEQAVKELGDIRWYLELAAYALNVSMEEIEAKNIAKLRARYPQGFTEAAAAARVDTKAGDDPCGAV